jgi:hypothetical protein
MAVVREAGAMAEAQVAQVVPMVTVENTEEGWEGVARAVVMAVGVMAVEVTVGEEMVEVRVAG